MTTTSTQIDRARVAASRSLWSIAATVMLAAITHAYDFGAAAVVAGAMVLAIILALSSRYRRSGSRVAAALYGLLNLWVIIGFGFVGGVWNHAVKIGLSAMHGGTLPGTLEPLFMSPEVGGVTYETFWVLLGAASVVAAFFGYRFARVVRWSTRAGVAGQGVA